MGEKVRNFGHLTNVGEEHKALRSIFLSSKLVNIFVNDIHRVSFNVTLLIAGIFGLAAGGSSNFITLASLLAVVGVGVGGNQGEAGHLRRNSCWQEIGALDSVFFDLSIRSSQN